MPRPVAFCPVHFPGCLMNTVSYTSAAGTGTRREPEGSISVVGDMELRRYVGLVDLGVLTILVAAVVFPPREMYADSAVKATPEERFGLALAEAKQIVHPELPAHVDHLSDTLGQLGFKDWAIEVALDGSERTKGAPNYWQTQLATSVAYVDRLDAKNALKWAVEAYKSCGKAGDAGCPGWEKTRLEIYRDHL